METSPFLRQLFVAVSPLLAAVSVGGVASFPTVLFHQLQNNGSSIQLDMDTSSWLGSIHGLAGIPSIFLPTIMQWRGRKFAFITACLITILGWIVAFSASSTASLLISECLHGLGINSILAVSCLCISEMVSPKYRDTYMQTYGVLQISTMAINGLLTQYLHWKTITIVMCVPMVIAVVIACMWPESPYWLALRGEYDKCEKAFIWLRGTDQISRKELEQLLLTQKENSVKKSEKMSFGLFLNKIAQRDFYMPSLHMVVLLSLGYWNGTIVVMIYSIELVQKSTQNAEVSFYGGLIMNAVLTLGIVISIVLNRYYKKKTILLWGTVIVAITMFSASIVSYLQSTDLLPKDSNLCLYCLIAYMLANGIGIVSMVFNIAIEIMPVKHRGLGGALIVVCTCLFHSSALKISPYLFYYINLSGTFLFYTINTVLCGLFIWKYVPETRDRTLQEIEHYYNHGKFNEKHDDIHGQDETDELMINKPLDF